MNILLVNKFHYLKGGSEAVYFKHQELLRNAGHNVTCFSMKSTSNISCRDEVTFINHVDYNNGGIASKVKNASKILYSLEAKRKMGELLDEHEIDIAHFHIFQHQISPSVFHTLKKRNIPIVLTIHDLKVACPVYTMFNNGKVCEKCIGGSYIHCTINKCAKGSLFSSAVFTAEMYLHKWLKIYDLVDKYVVVSEFYKKKLVESGISEERIEYIPNPVDMGNSDLICENRGYVLFFGRLSEEKGIYTYLEAALENPSIDHYVVGTGPLEQQLKDWCDNNSVINVVFTGYKTGSDLETIIREAACSVVPSLWYENAPMSILESYEFGTPVVGSNIGGIPELIDDGIDGFLFEINDVKSLSNKVRRLVENPEFSLNMAQIGKRRLRDKFGLDKHLSSLQSLYSRVLNGKN